MPRKFATLHYGHRSMNLGDVIQSIAVERYLPSVDDSFDRETLGLRRNRENHVVVMNGWFTTRPEYWPPATCVTPIFFGFHLNLEFSPEKRRLLLGSESIAYFKRHEPIGCRDRGTQKLLTERGVKTFFSKCLTLTFETRAKAPCKHKVFLVDVDRPDIFIPDSIAQDAETTTHVCDHTLTSETKRSFALSLLERYRTEASLVVTTRLHCALPCIAMGIPVVFFGEPENSRLALLSDIGLPVNSIAKRRWYARTLNQLRQWSEHTSHWPVVSSLSRGLYQTLIPIVDDKTVDWSPVALDIDAERESIKQSIRDVLATVPSDV